VATRLSSSRQRPQCSSRTKPTEIEQIGACERSPMRSVQVGADSHGCGGTGAGRTGPPGATGRRRSLRLPGADGGRPMPCDRGADPPRCRPGGGRRPGGLDHRLDRAPIPRDPSRFEPWLHRILTRACYAEARRRTRWFESPRILPVAGAYGPDEYLNVDDRDLLERAFRRLTLQQRAVLIFHHYLGLSISEVAERTGLPVGTAKSRLHYATRALRASIDADARATATSQERMA
jgi:RNA polymerase sigma factor (sigma-70 family)